MSVYTPVPVHQSGVYTQRTLTLPARNLSQPDRSVTPLHYLGSGKAPPPAPATKTAPQTKPSAPINEATPDQCCTLPVHKPALPVQAPPAKPVRVVPLAPPVKSPAGVSVAETAPTDTNPLDTVFFPVSANLVADHYLPRLEHLAPDRCYLVVGHSDPTGPKPLILGLSVSRASAVATVMRTAGLKVDIEGVGDYGASHKPMDYPKDRRAEVWDHPCPGTPAPANPPPPPSAKLGSISVQVTQAKNGQWQTTVTRRFHSKAAAQAWASQMQKQPPMQADRTGAGQQAAQLGTVATIATGLRGMQAALQAKATDFEARLNHSASAMSAALTLGVRQWLATSPAASFGNWHEAMASIGSPIGTLPTVKISPAIWNTMP